MSQRPLPPVSGLTRELAQAHDAKLVQIVELIDAMESRGAADALIAPLRPRLQQLRPHRRPRFGRLLCLPLDPVIVEATHWQPDAASVPRSALRPLIEIIRNSLGPVAAEIDSALAAEQESLGAVGARLWPEAAPVLRKAAAGPLPADWPETGLPADRFAPLARAVAGVLSQSVRLYGMAHESVVTRKDIALVLTGAAEDGVEAARLAIAVLLATVPDARRMLSSVRQMAGPAAEQAIDSLLAQIDEVTVGDGRLEAANLDSAILEVRRVADLVSDLSAGAGPRRRDRIAAVRQAMLDSCHRRLESGLTEELLGPIRALPAQPASEDMTTLEHCARNLRCLDEEAQRIGPAADNQRLLRQATEQIKHSPLANADLVRLVEILAGPEEALSLLKLSADSPDRL